MNSFTYFTLRSIDYQFWTLYCESEKENADWFWVEYRKAQNQKYRFAMLIDGVKSF